jgi:hopanoid biosynthesis associated RND transporter like protein HpnN
VLPLREEQDGIPRPAAAHHGLIPDLLWSVTRTVSRRPGSSLWFVTLLVLISLVVSGRFLSFRTKRADLIDPDAPFQQRWLEYAERFGDAADAVVVVEAPDEATVRQVLDDLGRQLEAEPHLFDRVFYKFDPAGLKRKALQYLSPSQLEICRQFLDGYTDVLNGQWDRAGLQATTEQLTQRLDRQDTTFQQLALAQAQQFIESLRTFVGSGEFNSPWPSCMGEASGLQDSAFEPSYQITDAGTMGILLTIPVSDDDAFEGPIVALNRLRELSFRTQDRYEGVEIGLTGIPVLESDEMLRSQSDMTLASLISFVGVMLLLFVGFRGFRHPLLGMVMLLVGLAWSLGFATLFVGHLNILSVSFTAILVGLGIDFAIHYLARYLELRHKGLSLHRALLQTSWSVGTGIVAAAVTTALAFFCATFTSFLGIAELGIIAGGGILLCCVTTFVVLPALIALADRNLEPRRLPTPFQGNALRRMTSRYPGIVTLVSTAAAVVVSAGCFTIEDGRLTSRVAYDANLLNLQADDVESVEVQQRLFREADGSLLYAVSQADGPGEVLMRRDAFLELPSVSRVEELASHFPQHDPQQTRELVQAIHMKLSGLSDFPREFPRLNPQAIGHALEELLLRLRKIDAPQARETVRALDAVLERLEGFPLEQQSDVLDKYQYAMLASLRGQLEALAAIADPTPVSPTDFPAPVRERFVSDDGTWLLRIFPKHQIWDEEPLKAFVEDVRSVDPNVTGAPLQNFEASRQIRESYIQAAMYALAIIWLVLLVDAVETQPLLIGLLTPLLVIAFAVIAVPAPEDRLDPLEMFGLYVALATAAIAIFDFKNVRNMFLAMLPPVVGEVLMFGILGLCGISLNPANLIVLPLILGIGVDDGVHMIHDFRMQAGRYRISASTINAIVLTSLTSIIGFGSMLISAHRGLASLGLVLSIGIGTCLFVSLVMLPAILTLISRRQWGELDSDHAATDELEASVVPSTVSLLRNTPAA